jgi:hypothetical protein
MPSAMVLSQSEAVRMSAEPKAHMGLGQTAR